MNFFVQVHLGVSLSEKKGAGLEFIPSPVEGLQSFCKEQKGFMPQSLTQIHHRIGL